MFQLIFSAMSALNQVAVFAAALVFGGVGVLVVGNAIYWRLHAARVQGEVIGVRRNGNCLNAVYRYDSPAGESVEATSTEGSDSVRGKETGRVVPLWVIPEKPHEVQERGNHLFTVLGLVFLASGVALFWVGATAWRTGPMTWVVGGLFFLHLLHRLRRVLAPGEKTLPRSGWLAVTELLKAARTSEPSPLQPVEELNTLPEFRDRQIRARAQFARLAPLLLLIGAGSLALGVHESHALLGLEASGTRASGLVTALIASRGGNGGITYRPVVCYTDHSGRTVVFRDSMASNPPLYHVGEPVRVLYPPGEPGRAVIDRGVWNWAPSATLYLLGGALVSAGLAAWRRRGAEDGSQTVTLGPAA
jgi:hypothetical protein